VAERSGKEGMT